MDRSERPCPEEQRTARTREGQRERRALSQQSWQQLARAGSGSAERPMQMGAPQSTRSHAVSARTNASGAHARSAGGRASARSNTKGADARGAGARASASTSASGAHAGVAGARASARNCARGAIARSAGGRLCPHQRRRSDCKECRVQTTGWARRLRRGEHLPALA